MKDDIFSQLVAIYGNPGEPSVSKDLSKFHDDEYLMNDLRQELDRILKEKSEPFPMKLYMATAMRAFQVLRGSADA
jgi:hypothetical protein